MRARVAVTLTWAQSLDGCIAPADRRRVRLSGEASLVYTHRLRAEHEAILVGIGTVLADDPLLTCRLVPCDRQPIRLVLDGRLRLPPQARLFEDVKRSPLWVLTHEQNPPQAEALRRRGAEVFTLENLQPLTVATWLKTQGLSSLLVEGGSAVLGSFFQAGVYDRLEITVTPRLLGEGLRALPLPVDFVPVGLEGGNWAILGSDVVFRWRRL